MDSFETIKRRASDLASQVPVPKAFPNLPTMPTFAAVKSNSQNFASTLPTSITKLTSSLTTPSTSQQTVKTTWQRIQGTPSLPRSSHTVNVVAGTAYIFGGESSTSREPVDNDMHAIVLPASGAETDYYVIKAKPAPRETPPPDLVVESHDQDPAGDAVGLSVPKVRGGVTQGGRSFSGSSTPVFGGDVPKPRLGHASAVIGNRILIFGGRGADGKELDESGRVWVFDTRTREWSFLDPLHPVSNTIASPVDGPPCPRPRSFHAAAASEEPRSFGMSPSVKKKKGNESWMQWLQGDSAKMGTPQAPKVGYTARHAKDDESEGYGTFIIHAGCLSDGTRGNDVWAFDVHSRVWQELPSAPGNARGGTSIAITKSRLYRFGGFNGQTEEGGQLDYLHLGLDSMSYPGASRHVMLSAKSGGWQSIMQPSAEDQLVAAAAAQETQGLTANTAMNQKLHDWPANRSVAGFQAVTAGGGREYLILMFGEGNPSNAGHAAAGKFRDDIWAYEVPLRHDKKDEETPAGVGDAVMGFLGRAGIGKGNGEGNWFRVETGAWDEDDEISAQGPGARGWFASSTMGDVDERGLLVWGGLNADNARLSDGWMLRVGAEKREI